MTDTTAELTTPAAPEEASGTGILVTGWTFMLTGLFGAFYAFGFDVSIGTYGLEDIANSDLIATRTMWMIGASAAFLAGIILIGAGCVVRAITRPATATA